MSWNQSPRKPRMQQQSWEGTPTINLYEPNREFYDSSPNMPLASVSSVSSQVKNSPTNQSRKINYNKYCLPNPKHQISDPGTYYNSNVATTSLKSPKSPREQTFEFELSTPPQSSRSPLKNFTPNRRFYDDTSTSDSAPATLVSQRKYEFGAVSPKMDNPGMFFEQKNFPLSRRKNGKLNRSIIYVKTFLFHLQARKNLNISPRQRHRLKMKTQI